MRKVVLSLKTASGKHSILVELDVLWADIPALLGMGILDRQSLTPCTVMSHVVKRVHDPESPLGYKYFCYVPLVRSPSGHLYASMQYTITAYITRLQLLKLHRYFANCASEKLFTLLQSALPEDARAETRRVLEEIRKHCHKCQKIHVAPRICRVTMGTVDIQFNESFQMGIMILDGKRVLHVIDEGTRLKSAQLLSNKTTQSVWNTFLRCWCNIYVGMPNWILVDHGTEFGDLFMQLPSENSCVVDRTGTQSPSSLGLC